MSQLLPQIKSHRAMCSALRESADSCSDGLAKAMLVGMAKGHELAADALEAGMLAELKKLAKPPPAKDQK